MKTIKELEKEIEDSDFGVDKIEKKALQRILKGLDFDYGHIHKSLLLKTKLQTLQEVLKLIEEDINFQIIHIKKHYEANLNNKSNVQVKKEVAHRIRLRCFNELKQKIEGKKWK